jgi:hypothetical protein
VASVGRGFKGNQEINTVIYDADKIKADVMVKALKDAGTYRGTAKD